MLKRVLGAFGLVVVVLGGAAYFVLRARLIAAGDRIVERARELDARQFERPSHDPVPGTLGELFAPQFEEGSHKPIAFHADCEAVAYREQPRGLLSKDCEDAWRRDGGWASHLLAASRAEGWSRVPELHGLERYTVSRNGLYVLKHGFGLAALSVQEAPPDDAVRLCVDGLALLRDQAAQSDAEGATFGVDMQHRWLKPCAAAFPRATVETRRWASRALTVINDTWPRTGAWLPYELINATRTSHAVLTAEQRSRLPASARIRLISLMPQELVLRTIALPRRVAFFERLEALSTLEPSKRNAAAIALQDALSSAWNPAERVLRLSYAGLLKREDDRREELARFIAAINENAAESR